MKKWLCLALAMVFLLCVGCGEEKADSATATPTSGGPQPNPDLKVEECYTYTENKDGTYSYEVEWRGGGVLCSEKEITRPVSFDAANEDILIISGQAGTGVTARWAKFCDIERGRVSETFGAYLAAVGNRVAFLDNRTDAYHVFVCDPFESHEYTQVVTLEGLVADGDVIRDFELGEDGVLTVTYATEDGDKTVTVDLNEAEE